MMCAITMVVNPVRTFRSRKSDSSEEPSTTSGRGERQHQQEAHGAAAAEPVAAERERDQRAEDRGHQGRDGGYPEAQLHRLDERGVLERIAPRVERERLPDEVELPRRLVEAVQHRHEDRQEEIREHERRVAVEQPGPEPPHQARSSVPSTRA